MPTYLHQLDSWPELSWNSAELVSALNQIHHQHGRLLGKLEVVGSRVQQRTMLQPLSAQMVRSFEDEGLYLDQLKVASSIARRLGIESPGFATSDLETDIVVKMMLDATQNCEAPLTEERLFTWYATLHASLFPTDFSALSEAAVSYRKTPSRVVSKTTGKICLEAVKPSRIASEMKTFIYWFETPDSTQKLDPVVKAGLALLRFLIIRPFDDGNERIARMLCEMLLARAAGNPSSARSPLQYFGLSSQLISGQADCYHILELIQEDESDVSTWLLWFLDCLACALKENELLFSKAMAKLEFWHRYETLSFNERQRKVINVKLEGLEEKLRTSNWARIASCSHDTALRDIEDLMYKGVLEKETAGGRSTSYRLVGLPLSANSG